MLYKELARLRRLGARLRRAGDWRAARLVTARHHRARSLQVQGQVQTEDSVCCPSAGRESGGGAGGRAEPGQVSLPARPAAAAHRKTSGQAGASETNSPSNALQWVAVSRQISCSASSVCSGPEPSSLPAPPPTWGATKPVAAAARAADCCPVRGKRNSR